MTGIRRECACGCRKFFITRRPNQKFFSRHHKIRYEKKMRSVAGVYKDLIVAAESAAAIVESSARTLRRFIKNLKGGVAHEVRKSKIKAEARRKNPSRPSDRRTETKGRKTEKESAHDRKK